MPLKYLDDGTAFCSISTFSGGGIGDCGIEWGCDLPVISVCELEDDRAGLIRHNFGKDVEIFGDIEVDKIKIIKHANNKLKNRSPWLFVMSPPCQGMSSNGAGRISASIRSGKRPKEDIRNKLFLPGIEIIESLEPSWFIIENVKRMENTVITNEKGQPERILDNIKRKLEPAGYTIRSAVIDFKDLGVPHHRERLITIGTNLELIKKEIPPGIIFSHKPTKLHPELTHGEGRRYPHVTLRDVIQDLPKLDAITNQYAVKTNTTKFRNGMKIIIFG